MRVYRDGKTPGRAARKKIPPLRGRSSSTGVPQSSYSSRSPKSLRAHGFLLRSANCVAFPGLLFLLSYTPVCSTFTAHSLCSFFLDWLVWGSILPTMKVVCWRRARLRPCFLLTEVLFPKSAFTEFCAILAYLEFGLGFETVMRFVVFGRFL